MMARGVTPCKQKRFILKQIIEHTGEELRIAGAGPHGIQTEARQAQKPAKTFGIRGQITEGFEGEYLGMAGICFRMSGMHFFTINQIKFT